jgi:hypothetical protein
MDCRRRRNKIITRVNQEDNFEVQKQSPSSHSFIGGHLPAQVSHHLQISIVKRDRGVGFVTCPFLLKNIKILNEISENNKRRVSVTQ